MATTAIRPLHRPIPAVSVLRWCFGLLFASGSIIHAVVVTTAQESYSSFADRSPFPWITEMWRSVLVPNVEIFIPILAVFELVVGVLILGKGWRARAGLWAALAFHLALTLFGLWPYTLPAGALLVLLLRYDYGPALGRVYSVLHSGLSPW